MTTPARVAAVCCLGLALGGCGEQERADPASRIEESAPEPSAEPEPGVEPALVALPALLRATVVLEPPRIEIGDPFTIEIAVVTPPDHRVAPAPVPKAVEGLWILEAERPSVERQPGRWVHHQRFRARARSTGPFLWPALELGVEGPDGAKRTITAPERPFEVSSLLAEHPEQRSFFSYRTPRLRDADGRGPWLPALLGASFALAAVGLLSLVRRARSAAATAAAVAETEAPEGDDAGVLEALRRAGAAAGDPVHAADLASEALRGWAAERFRAPSLLRATTEELAASPVPFLLSTRFEALLALLRELDALRFPPPPADASLRASEAIARAAAFVARVGARS